MKDYVVTMRYKKGKSPHWHNPNEKQKGNCPMGICSDMTGNHHSFVVNTDLTMRELEKVLENDTMRVSRIEVMISTMIRREAQHTKEKLKNDQ